MKNDKFREFPRDRACEITPRYFRQSIQRPCGPFDEIDHAAADPIIDRAPAVRSREKTNRVLELLDVIERGEG